MEKKKTKKTKKNTKVIGKTPAHYNEDVMKMIKIGVIVIACFAIIYFVTAFINGEFSNKEEEQEEVQIQNEEILMGETFEKSDSEYMIMYYDFTDNNYSNLYAMLVETYKAEEDALPMYIVDLSTNFSKKYMAKEGESSNKNPTSLSNLKISGATLIRIKDKKVINYIEGKDNIKNYIEELTKDDAE